MPRTEPARLVPPEWHDCLACVVYHRAPAPAGALWVASSTPFLENEVLQTTPVSQQTTQFQLWQDGRDNLSSDGSAPL
eukprot:3058707-Alexandrium_andersonii.AAC.1